MPLTNAAGRTRGHVSIEGTDISFNMDFTAIALKWIATLWMKKYNGSAKMPRLILDGEPNKHAIMLHRWEDIVEQFKR